MLTGRRLRAQPRFCRVHSNGPCPDLRLVCSLTTEVSERLVGFPVFKTGEGPHGPWRVRFPSTSATAPVDPPSPMPSPRRRLAAGRFDSPGGRSPRFDRSPVPSPPLPLRVDPPSPMPSPRQAAAPLPWRVRFPSTSATAPVDPPSPMPSPRQAAAPLPWRVRFPSTSAISMFSRIKRLDIRGI